MSCPTVRDVIAWLDNLLDPTRRPDYGPNGLQVDASPPSLGFAGQPVSSIVTGVTANLALIELAIERGADLLVVHHGLYWKDAPVTATGMLGRRLARCFESRLSIAGYHLPLDAHPEVGNAAGLADALGLVDQRPAFLYMGLPTGCIGRFPEPLTPSELEARLLYLSPRALLFPGGPSSITSVGIVTGGAPRLAHDAADLGLDLFVTGECTEFTQALAAERGLHLAAAGHHRTEVFGPKRLAARLRDAFPDVEVEFVDVDNPA